MNYIFKQATVLILIGGFIILSTSVKGQHFGESFYVTELKTFGPGLMDSLWKYRDAGMANGADPAINDMDWNWVTTQDLLDITGKPISPSKRKGWFRKWVTIPDSLLGKTIVLMMGQTGASEIYLDGKRIKQYGVLSNGSENGKSFIPHEPFFIHLDSQARHLFAVLYESNENHTDFGIIVFQGFRLLASAPESANLQLNRPIPVLVVSASFMAAFFLFFCFIYAFYPGRISSLLSALLLADFTVLFTAILLWQYNRDGESFLSDFKWWKASVVFSAGLYTLFLYGAYYRKLIRRSWIVLGLMVVSFIVAMQFSLIAAITIGNLFTIESARIIFLGLKNKKTGFLILAIAFSIDLLGRSFVIFDFFHIFPSYPTTLHSVLSVATNLDGPLGLALYLAWEFGSANRDLRIQLDQVNRLSIENIQKEQEKQFLLSTQNELLERQVSERTLELTGQKDELESALENLKSTQTQLIQAEKMASLGELTAGIAHEIQNPLNFVNNFSEVNSELVKEMEEEINRGNFEEVKSIAKDIKENEKKISHHGKRADAIVKGMLQHTNSNSGVYEWTNVNALTEEYLRLAFHSLRAKDKEFNALVKTEYDPAVGDLKIIAQDIGRVLLNLFSNAFYSVSEQKKNLSRAANYEPFVLVQTRKTGNKIEIGVRDNGNGVSQKILNKIFQPFFTTKPTGQGTGLGLSISYDIMKAHGGELRVQSKEGEGAEFIIIIPYAGIGPAHSRTGPETRL